MSSGAKKTIVWLVALLNNNCRKKDD